MPRRTEPQKIALESTWWVLLILALIILALIASPASAAGRQEIVVAPSGAVTSLSQAIRLARPGARVVVKPGIYREPTIVVDRPLEIVGEGWPVFDGGGRRQIMSVRADDVTVRGLVLRNVGSSMTEDRAAIAVSEASGCAILGNRIEAGFFGIHLSRVSRCRIANNVLKGSGNGETGTGNGIHLWTANQLIIEDNHVSGHRDGIYFEFVTESAVRRNLSHDNRRYGLHFMYSDDCEYTDNVFRQNLAGVAVMYTKRVEMTGNRFEDNWGSASYGLLLKEILEPRIVRNVFARNTVGLVADGATRIVAEDNRFVGNGWALKLQSSTYGGRFSGNDFIGNTFDVATNARQSDNVFEGNYYEQYAGYDLDRDGIGDVAHRPVRLFSVVVENNPPTLILLRGVFMSLLDVAERVAPVLTPAALVDAKPVMRPVVRSRP